MDKAIFPSDEHKIKKYCTELINGKYYCYYNKRAKDDYKEISDFLDVIKNRLSNVGYELIKSEQNKTIYADIESELPSKHQNFNIIKSKTVLHLLKKYFSDIKNIDTGIIVYYKWNELLKDLQDIYNGKKERNEIIDILWLLKNINIIDINTTKNLLKDNDENDQITISIFPAIKCICKFDNIDSVEQKLESYNTTRQIEEFDESIEEDNENE